MVGIPYELHEQLRFRHVVETTFIDQYDQSILRLVHRIIEHARLAGESTEGTAWLLHYHLSRCFDDITEPSKADQERSSKEV